LKLLRDQGYPIEGSAGRGGGIRLHPSYGLSKIQLSTEQSIGMLLSLAIGEKLGLPFFSEQLRPARQKITQAFAESQRAIVRRLQERVFVGSPASTAVISSYKIPNSKITKVVEMAFLMEQKIEIRYVDEKGQITKRTIEPHGILRLRHIKGLFNPNPRYPRPAPGDLSSFPHINPYVTRPPRHRGLCLLVK
jgi:predicted DNA-binding transcriptional regulator YafY